MRTMTCRSVVRKFGVLFATALVTESHDWAADLPADKFTEWTTEKDIFVPMRDGIHLDTDVLLPKGATEKLSTVLIRSPYDKGGDPGLGAEPYLKQGYAVVVQNERGRYFSEGYFKNYLQGASTDGHDAVEWIVKQPWSNGKVGSIGCSSSGETQWPMAVSNPPGLEAIIPAASGTAVGDIPGNETRGAFYRGGVPFTGFWAWWWSNLVPSERLLLPPNSTEEQRIRLRNGYSLTPKVFDPNHVSETYTLDWTQYRYLPTENVLRALGGPLTGFDSYVKWSPHDTGWNEVEHIGAGAKPRVPALHLVTWYDPAVGETTRLFKYLQDLGTPDQYLIIGAGPHCSMFWEGSPDLKISDLQSYAKQSPDLKLSDLKLSSLSHLRFGDLEVGDARYSGNDRGYQKLVLDWFGYWLNGEQNHVTDMPKVQLFVMAKGWIYGDRWPLKQTRFTKYYLSADRASRLRHEAGALTTSPSNHEQEDTYVYDPASPTPSSGGDWGHASALDQRQIEVRNDVLVYSTPPLDNPLTIAGPIDVVLYVSSSAKDTDFMVKLVDVYPDGKSINLSDDAFRVRYREGFDKKVLMQPGKVYKITLSDMVTAVKLASGHRIRLDISSSNFPFYERNLNTGGNNYDETKWVVAENSVHHGKQYPSYVVLPVLPE
jgi:putative CocE/NonD family hydrolase